MNRRSAIKQLFIIAGGIAIATSCDLSSNATSIELKNIQMVKKDEQLLAAYVEAILPKTDSPGAKELNLHLFVMKMLDDCSSPEDQKLFLESLKAAHEQKANTAEEILAYLKGLPEGDKFFSILKWRTIQGYKNSEYVMKNKLKYELVPGRYNGEFLINA
ncbi:gluconate 2-dehydrogenase subunit 3 family protein [Sphingobacterium sp. HJSM2_6]|uniref:gluconate 2-dehydrogenase subunit 3 family protein n=1 Tax=Sphingobacterium sp. HJSM2_6 TaxID=3366264 RepID=UPI003BC2BAC2